MSDGEADGTETRGRDGGDGETKAGGGSYHLNMVAEHGSDPCLQEAVAEEAAGDGGLGGINDSKTSEQIEAEGDGSGPREACRIRFEMKQQNEKIVEMQEVETEKQVIMLDMVYEKLQGLERMIDEACREQNNDQNGQGQRGGIKG